jgi:hypothetical protein
LPPLCLLVFSCLRHLSRGVVLCPPLGVLWQRRVRDSDMKIRL